MSRILNSKRRKLKSKFTYIVSLTRRAVYPALMYPDGPCIDSIDSIDYLYSRKVVTALLGPYVST